MAVSSNSVLVDIIASAASIGIWNQYGADAGLPSLKIEAIFEDSHGVLWIGTHDQGVVYYEGDEFIPLSCSGAPDGGVFGIVEDRERSIWFAVDQGLICYDGHSCRSLDLEEPIGFLWGNCIDRAGNLWFGLDRRPGRPAAVCRWDGQSLKIVPVSEQSTLKGQSIHCVAVDVRGRLWCGGDGLYVSDGGEFFEVTTKGVGQIAELLVRTNGEVWVADGQGNLYLYRENSLVFISELSPMKAGGEEITVTGLQEDGFGRIWAVVRNGKVLCYDDGKLVAGYQLDALLWKSFCIDRSGRLWVGSFGQGIYCYDETRFRRYLDEEGQPIPRARCLTEDRNGRLWVGTIQGLYGRHQGSFQASSRLGEREITALLVDRQQRLWAGTREGRLYLQDKRGLRDVFGTSAQDIVFSLVEDGQGRVWFGARFGTGVGYFEDGRTHLLPQTEVDYPTWVGALAVDEEGILWIGSASPAKWDGLCRWDGTSFERVAGLSGVSIYALYFDEDGILWMGSNKGLWRYDGASSQTFTKEDGLPFNIVTALCQDREGLLWIGTEGGGLCCYDGHVFRPVQIPLEPRYNVIHAIHLDQEGRLWLATEGGLVEYRPELDLKTPAPEVSLQSRFQVLSKQLGVSLLGHSAAWQQALDALTPEVVESDLTILLLGETGTGKGVVARAIHELSPRRYGPFIPFNCSAMPEHLAASILFGHEKGAFTSADMQRQGLFEQAEGGTLFLDEIGDMSPEIQVYFLQVLQERTFRRVGGHEGLSARNVRIIAATNCDLQQVMREGRFRVDLYYRIHVITVQLPPLRERKEDISLLANYFLRKAATDYNKEIASLSDQALRVLLDYDWPGNVRELEHAMLRAGIRSHGRKILPGHFILEEMDKKAWEVYDETEEELPPLGEVERRYFTKVLEKTGGKLSGTDGAAEIVGMHPETLRVRLKKLGLK